jgi:hypothetical protein
MDEASVRQSIREQLTNGRLPLDNPRSHGAAAAVSTSCAACGEEILSGASLVLEELAGDDDGNHRFHPRCYLLLVNERATRRGEGVRFPRWA